MRLIVAILLMSCASVAFAAGKSMPLTCIGLASAEFGLPPRLLHAVYLTEGGKIGWGMMNSNGSIDHGPFQINTALLKQLKPYGVNASNLAWDPLLNARVAAWHLRSEIIRARGDVWRGVGNYHSRTPKFHQRQVQRVAKRYQSIPAETNYFGGKC